MKKFTWTCPSNIALIKYWGKKPHQIPCNASLSMTLSKASTELSLELHSKDSKSSEIECDYYFEGKKNEKFEHRVREFLQTQQVHFPFLKDFALHFQSKNSFPHSTGIASSASAFGAIALALCDAKNQLSGVEKNSNFMQEASNIARQGSGSACRSLFPSYALWGKVEDVTNSSDEYAIPITDVHLNFQNMCDAILIVDSAPKKVSSSLGHSLMNNHPYAAQRFVQANQRVSEMISVLRNGDYERYIQLTESEALTLHAMMLTSHDYYLLMRPQTLEIIEKIFKFRQETKIPVCFTLDAGPNIHLLYANSYQEKVEEFLNSELKNHIQEIKWDKIGLGPQNKK